MKKNKKGFTLLEVILAVAIMLIASTMILQGFIATLVYSANTALYAKTGAGNSDKMYDVVVTKRGKNKDTGNTSYDGMNSTVGTIKFTFDSGTKSYRVNTWAAKNAGSKVKADEDNNTSFNRYAVTYALPDIKCDKCGVKNVGISAETGKWICTVCKKELTAPTTATDP